MKAHPELFDWYFEEINNKTGTDHNTEHLNQIKKVLNK